MQRRGRPHQIEDVSPRVAVCVGQEYWMQALIECLAQELFVEMDRVKAQEGRGTPGCELLSNLAHHGIVGLPRHAVRVVKRDARDMQRLRGGHDVRHQPRSCLEPIDFDECDVGSDRSELEDLVEAFVQTRGFYVVEDERHAGPVYIFWSLNWKAARLTLNRF